MYKRQNVVFICVNMFFAVLLALLLSELTFRKTAKTLQTIYMLPYFLSWAVVSIILIAFLDRDYGLVNAFIRMTGARGMTDWYAVSEIWPGLLVFINAWKNVGYQTVLYLAAVSYTHLHRAYRTRCAPSAWCPSRAVSS